MRNVSQFRLQPQTSWNLDDSIEKVATWNRTWSFQTLLCKNTPWILEKTRRDVALKQDKNSSWWNLSIQHELGRHLYPIFWPCLFLELSKRPFFCTNGNEANFTTKSRVQKEDKLKSLSSTCIGNLIINTILLRSTPKSRS